LVGSTGLEAGFNRSFGNLINQSTEQPIQPIKPIQPIQQQPIFYL